MKRYREREREEREKPINMMICLSSNPYPLKEGRSSTIGGAVSPLRKTFVGNNNKTHVCVCDTRPEVL